MSYWATKTMNKISLETSMSLTQSNVLRTLVWSNLDWQRALAVQENSHNEKLLREEKWYLSIWVSQIENSDFSKIWTSQKCRPQAEIQISEEMRTVFSEVRIFWGPYFRLRSVFPLVPIVRGLYFLFEETQMGTKKNYLRKFNNLHQDASLRNCIELFHSGFPQFIWQEMWDWWFALLRGAPIKHSGQKIIHTGLWVEKGSLSLGKIPWKGVWITWEWGII